MRSLAKRLAELTGEFVVLSAGPQRAYTTGVSQLFEKPEFHERDMMVRFGGLMDRMEQLFEPIFKENFDGVRILVGNEGPFGEKLSSVMVRFRRGDGQEGMISIVGPMRMNYERNIALLREAKKLLKKM